MALKVKVTRVSGFMYRRAVLLHSHMWRSACDGVFSCVSLMMSYLIILACIIRSSIAMRFGVMKAGAISWFFFAALAVFICCLQARPQFPLHFRPHRLPPPMVFRLIALEEREEKLKKQQEKLTKARKGKK